MNEINQNYNKCKMSAMERLYNRKCYSNLHFLLYLKINILVLLTSKEVSLITPLNIFY